MGKIHVNQGLQDSLTESRNSLHGRVFSMAAVAPAIGALVARINGGYGARPKGEGHPFDRRRYICMRTVAGPIETSAQPIWIHANLHSHDPSSFGQS